MKKTVFNKLIIAGSVLTMALLTGCGDSSSDNEKQSVSTRNTDRIVNTAGVNNTTIINNTAPTSACNLNSTVNYSFHLTPGQAQGSQFSFNDYVSTYAINESISFNNVGSGAGMKFHYCQASNTLEYVFVDDFALGRTFENVLRPAAGLPNKGANYKNYGNNVSAFGDEFGTLLIVNGAIPNTGDVFYEVTGQLPYYIGSFSLNSN